MTMRIKMTAAAPTAGAVTTLAAGSSNVNQTPGNVQITAGPGGPAQEAAQLQQPFGGAMGALIFHH